MMGAIINIGAVVGEGTMIDMGAVLAEERLSVSTVMLAPVPFLQAWLSLRRQRRLSSRMTLIGANAGYRRRT